MAQKKLTFKRNQIILDVIPFLILVGLSILFFSKLIMTGKSLLGMDFIQQFYPWKGFIYKEVWSNNSIPFWNPYLFSGTPFIANIQASMFYPLGFLYYLVRPDLAYTYTTMIHCILGSFFMYAFMRTISVSRSGAFISAIIFMFNGYFMGHLYAGHLSFIQNYIWIPLIFLFLYKFIITSLLKFAFLAGLALGVQILGGFPQIAFYTILGILFFGLFHGVAFIRMWDSRNALKFGLGLGLILLTGFALSSIQILPTFEFTRLSTRAGGVSFDFATYDSLHPKELLSFLLPDIYGNAVDKTYWRSTEFWHFWETCGYVGILPLFFVFVRIKGSSIRGLRIFFLILIILSLFLALGKYNPLYIIIYRLPGFNNFRIPAQIIFLYIFGISVVSGIGMDRLQEYGWKLNKTFIPFYLSSGGVLLISLIGCYLFPYDFFFFLFKNFSEGPVTHAHIAQLYDRVSLSIYKAALLFLSASILIISCKSQRLNLRVFNILVPVFIFMDLFLFGAQFVRSYEFNESLEKKGIIKTLKKRPDNGRVVTKSDLFQPNDGLLYGFPAILGYNPLILRRYVYYIQSSQNYNFDDHVVNLIGIRDLNAKLIKLLNVRQLVSGRGSTSLNNEIPYAHIVKNAVIKPVNEVLDFMKSDDFDPLKMVVFEPGYRTALKSPVMEKNIVCSCSVLDYGNESIHIKASTNMPSYLVLSEIFYPGWRAEVDGKDTSILRGNYLFSVIPLGKGDHDIRLYFISMPFRVGLIISIFTLSCAIFFILWNKRRPIWKGDAT